MRFETKRWIWRFKWHITAVYIALIAVLLLAIFTDIFRTTRVGEIPQLVWLLGALVLLTAVLVVLSQAFRILGSTKEIGAKLEKATDALEKIRTELTHINQNTRLSETAKMIAFREADRQDRKSVV